MVWHVVYGTVAARRSLCAIRQKLTFLSILAADLEGLAVNVEVTDSRTDNIQVTKW